MNGAKKTLSQDQQNQANAAPGRTGRTNCCRHDVLVTPTGCAPVLAHVPTFWQNPRGSLAFMAYPFPKACQQRVLGSWGPSCLGVAHSASSPKAAQALGCSLTPGLRFWFGQVTCMARAASVPGLGALGVLL